MRLGLDRVGRAAYAGIFAARGKRWAGGANFVALGGGRGTLHRLIDLGLDSLKAFAKLHDGSAQAAADFREPPPKAEQAQPKEGDAPRYRWGRRGQGFAYEAPERTCAMTRARAHRVNEG